MRTNPRKLPRQQAGFALLVDLVLMMIGAVAIYTVVLKVEHREHLAQSARLTGHDLAQYASGVREWIAANAGNMSVTNSTHTGVNWLKSPSCGGPATNPTDGYLPCSYTGTTPFGQTLTTVVARNGKRLTATTTLSRANLPDKVKDGKVANLIAQAAKAVPDSLATPAQGTFVNFTANDPANPLNPSLPKYGTVTAVASNAASLDAWLRTDGSNSMNAALNMDNHDVLGAKDIDGSGSVTMKGDVASTTGDVVAANGKVIGKQDVTSLAGNLVALNGGVVSRGTVYSQGGDVLAPNGNMLTKNVKITSTTVNGPGGIKPTLAQAVFDVRDVPNESYVNKPTCPSGTQPLIFLALRGGPTDKHALEGQPYDAGSRWYIRARYLNNNGNWVFLPANQVRLIATTKCS